MACIEVADDVSQFEIAPLKVEEELKALSKLVTKLVSQNGIVP